jgi:hypothetical protein
VVRVKTPFLVCAVPLLAAAGLQATPVTPCASTGTWATLETAGSCSIDGITYSDFTFLSSNVTASDLNYGIAGTGNGFNFLISNLDAAHSAYADMLIGFEVASSTSGIDLDSASLLQIPGTHNGGIAGIGETLCLDGPAIGCPKTDTKGIETYESPFGTSLSDNISFGSVQEIGVAEAVSVLGNGGFAQVPSFTEVVGVVDPAPEPGFYGVLAGGLAAIFLLAKRFKKTL